MKVIALSTVAVAAVYILLSIIVRAILYFFTKRNLDEVDDNNYLDHVNETSENDAQIDDVDVDEDSVQDENKTNTSTSDSSKSTTAASGVAVANRTTHDSDQQPHTRRHNNRRQLQQSMIKIRHLLLMKQLNKTTHI